MEHFWDTIETIGAGYGFSLFGARHLATLALFVGFEDAAYFSRFFKRYTGVSPKKFEYRGGNL